LVISPIEGVRVHVEESVLIPVKHGCVVSQVARKSVVFRCINWENFALLGPREVLYIRGRDDHGNLGLVALGAAI